MIKQYFENAYYYDFLRTSQLAGQRSISVCKGGNA